VVKRDPPKSGVTKDPPKSGVKKDPPKSGVKKTLKNSIRGQKRPSKAQSGVKKTLQSSIRGQKDPPKAGFSSIPRKGAPENPEKGAVLACFTRGLQSQGRKPPCRVSFAKTAPPRTSRGLQKGSPGGPGPPNPRNCSRKSIQEVNQDLRGAKDPAWLSRKGPIGPLNILILKVAKFL